MDPELSKRIRTLGITLELLYIEISSAQQMQGKTMTKKNNAIQSTFLFIISPPLKAYPVTLHLTGNARITNGTRDISPKGLETMVVRPKSHPLAAPRSHGRGGIAERGNLYVEINI